MRTTTERRKATRLRHHDYAEPGYYFFTAVTQRRAHLFGRIEDDEMVCNEAGHAVEDAWQGLPQHYRHVALDEFIVMPNHVHGLVALLANADVGAGFKPAQTRHGLPEVVRSLKTFSSRAINQLRGAPGKSVWQRNYYERVIRDEAELGRAREYIRLNPLKWHLDKENVESTRRTPRSTEGRV